MALSHEQIYTLNMLTYAGFDEGAQDAIGTDTARNLMQEAVDSGWTVKEYVQALETAYGDNASKYQEAFNRLKSDNTLSQMTIASYKQMEGSEANMIVFTDDANSEAVVAFEGSQSAGDWRDNFDGVGTTDQADGVSTQYQVNSLEYVNDVSDILSQYDTVTTTGHSKGGNNATYTNIMSDLVDRSVTFDAPGFSDEFYDKYSDRIARTQDSVDNYSANTDYVNILQNSVGDQHYIDMQVPDGYHDCVDGEGAPEFFLAHDPTVMQNYFYEGNPEVPQHPGLKALDEMLNSYLRYADPKDKEHATQVLGDLLARAFYEGDPMDALSLEDIPVLADFLGYCINYMNDNPDQAKAIRDAIAHHHPILMSFIEALTKVPGIAAILGGVSFVASITHPDPQPNGSDIHLQSIANRIVLDTDVLQSLHRRLQQLGMELNSCRSTVNSCADSCDTIHLVLTVTMMLHFIISSGFKLVGTPERVLRKVADSLAECSAEVQQLCNRLSRLISIIEENEGSSRDRAAALHIGETAPFTR